MPLRMRIQGPENDALVYTALDSGTDRAAFFRSLKHLKSQLSHKPPMSAHESQDVQRLQELGAKSAHLELAEPDTFTFASPEIAPAIGGLKTWQVARDAFGEGLRPITDDPRGQFTYVVACLFMRFRNRLARSPRQTVIAEPATGDPESFLPVSGLFR
jgi:hypothetical protein